MTILYRDIRTYGLREDFYQRARDLGVLFVRFVPEAKPQVDIDGDRITVQTFDYVLNRDIRLSRTRWFSPPACGRIPSRKKWASSTS